MTERGLVDWGLAERIAAAVGGDAGGAARSARVDETAVREAIAEISAPVRGYTSLESREVVPEAEALERADWSRLGLGTLREVAAELERELAGRIGLSGPLGGLARVAAAAAAAAEAGVAVGYASRRVLGQYDVSLGPTSRPPRLVFVAPNIAAVASELKVPQNLFLRWIAMHELTHALQFGSVEWLLPHIRQQVRQLTGAASARLEPQSLSHLGMRLLREPRAAVRALLRGDLPRLIAGPEQAEVIDRLQATMAVIEGYAEHVMDAVGATLDPGYRRLRAQLDRRRHSHGLADVIARLLGLELKLRQYRVGKEFCDDVVAAEGLEALNAVWESPEMLPTLAELEDPRAWSRRTQALLAEPTS